MKNGRGLFSEEVDPKNGTMMGNLPQAFSHIGFVNAALYLGIAKGRGSAEPTIVGGPEPGRTVAQQTTPGRRAS